MKKTAKAILLDTLNGIDWEAHGREGCHFSARVSFVQRLALLLLEDRIPLEFSVAHGEAQGGRCYLITDKQGRPVCTIYGSGSVTFA